MGRTGAILRKAGEKDNFRRFPVLLVVFILCVSQLRAEPVSLSQAEQAAAGWLRLNRAPMASVISDTAESPQVVTDQSGQPLYYAVNLVPEGFVILSANDEIEPIIAFSATGFYDDAAGNPLKVMLRKDMNGRLQALQRPAPADGSSLSQSRYNGREENQARWARLLSVAGPAGAVENLPAQASIDDVRVPPFVQTQWGQDAADGGYCYNYYTPNHYPTGCVATAMAQLMRYHTWPLVGIGRNMFEIHVNGEPENRYTRGGDGLGGAYDWNAMPERPADGLTTQEREAIGALNYDAALSVNMKFTAGGSSASTYTADQVLVSTYMYSNSIYTQNFTTYGYSQLWVMINSNLDAELPVVLGISRSGGGHAVVVDGYGYTSSTMYHHCNMGWDGIDNVWYQLPLIDAQYTYTVIEDCVYNVYASGTGEIISGRVTNQAGLPLEDVVIEAYLNSSMVGQVSTNSRGIYALANMPSNTQLRLTATKAGYAFSDQYVTTGRSKDFDETTGNQWGIDFVSANEMPPTALDSAAEVFCSNSLLIKLQALDDHQPDPPGELTYYVTSLPRYGQLSDPNIGLIDQTPYMLNGDDCNVVYSPCPYFGGQDSFTFMADDGGVPPSGGSSNIGTVTIDVDNHLDMEFGADSHSITALILDTEYFYDARTQVLMLQNEIGGKQVLTSLSLKLDTVPGRTLNNWTIRMQHTNWTVFDHITSMFPATGWTTVYQADETISDSGWVTFDFQTPFAYNGTQNLVIDFSFNNSGRTGPPGWHYFEEVGTDRLLALASQTGTHGDPLNWSFWSLGGSYYLSPRLPSMKLGGVVPNELGGDFDRSCAVDLADVEVLGQAWQAKAGDPNYEEECDIAEPKDGLVSLPDLLEVVYGWLMSYP